MACVSYLVASPRQWFEPVEGAFDDVASAVGRAVVGHRSAAGLSRCAPGQIGAITIGPLGSQHLLLLLTRRVDVGRVADTAGPEQLEDVSGADRPERTRSGVRR